MLNLTNNRATYRLLNLCAHATCSEDQYRELIEAADQLPSWEEIPAQAEAHGLAPLVYHHLTTAGVQIPPSIKGQLQGLYLRHRRTNQIRIQVLRKLLLWLEAPISPCWCSKEALCPACSTRRWLCGP
jgi:hypothetical protein